jgi:hypothetical protein
MPRSPLNQPWQEVVNPADAIDIVTLDHTMVGRATVHCPVSGRTEGTVRMEGRTCSFCYRPVTRHVTEERTAS